MVNDVGLSKRVAKNEHTDFFFSAVMEIEKFAL